EKAEWMLGRAPDGIDEEQLLDVALAGADLIFDATAEVGVQQFLAEQARRRGLPFVMVEATEGGYGGIVARFQPDHDAPCWMCLQYFIEDGTIVAPRDEQAESLQVAGCSSPTFTGTAFDLVPLSALAVRL